MVAELIPRKVTFLGCGKLNSAILEGILSSLSHTKQSQYEPPSHTPEGHHAKFLSHPLVVTPTALTACVHQQSSLDRLSDKFSAFPSVTVLAHSNVLGVQRSDIIILGVEPSVYRSVLAEHGVLSALQGKILVSLVGGVSVAKLQDAIFHNHPSKTEAEKAQHCHILRVTPSVAASVCESLSLISEEPHRSVPPAVLNDVYSLFKRVGQVKLWPEHLQPAGATIASCSPAFFSLAPEGVIESAVREGVEREEAVQMAALSMLGLSKLIAGGKSPHEVRRKVATPGGSTAAGLKVLEEGKVKESYMEAFKATVSKTSRLGDSKE